MARVRLPAALAASRMAAETMVLPTPMSVPVTKKVCFAMLYIPPFGASEGATSPSRTRYKHIHVRLFRAVLGPQQSWKEKWHPRPNVSEEVQPLNTNSSTNQPNTPKPHSTQPQRRCQLASDRHDTSPENAPALSPSAGALRL